MACETPQEQQHHNPLRQYVYRSFPHRSNPVRLAISTLAVCRLREQLAFHTRPAKMGCAASKEEPSPAAVDKPRSKVRGDNGAISCSELQIKVAPSRRALQSPVTATPAASSKSVNVANTVLGKQLAVRRRRARLDSKELID
jgi:hypothetical protein